MTKFICRITVRAAIKNEDNALAIVNLEVFRGGRDGG